MIVSPITHFEKFDIFSFHMHYIIQHLIVSGTRINRESAARIESSPLDVQWELIYEKCIIKLKRYANQLHTAI